MLHRDRIIREHFNVDILIVVTNVTPRKFQNRYSHSGDIRYTEIESLENSLW